MTDVYKNINIFYLINLIRLFSFSNFPASSSKERYGEVFTTSLLKYHSSSTTQMDPTKHDQIRIRPTKYV